MPFITQGKTNLKYILIVVLLAAIVGGGILWWGWSNRFGERPVSICGPSGIADWINVSNCTKSCEVNEDCKFTCGCGAINKNEICHDEGVIDDCVDRDVKCENSVCIEGEEKIKDETANWKTYRNEEFGFEFKYPPEWEISPSSNVVVALEHVNQRELGTYGIWVAVEDNPEQLSLRDYFRIQEQEYLKEPGEIVYLPFANIEPIKELTVDNKPAYQFILPGVITVRSTIFLHKSFVFFFDMREFGYPDPITGEPIPGPGFPPEKVEGVKITRDA